MKRLLWSAVLAAAVLGGLALWTRAIPGGVQSRPSVRLGISVGGRTVVLLWAYEKNKFKKANLDVTLLAESSESGEFVPVPRGRHKRPDMFKGARKRAERTTGVQLIERMLQGQFEGVTVGGAPFLESVARGLPIVAIAGMGHERSDRPGGGIVFRKAVQLRTPADLRGKSLVAKQTGAGHGLVLREFLRSVGLDADRDVRLFERVPEEEAKRGLLDGTYDGGYFNLGDIREFIKKGSAYLYRPLNWMQPELLQSYLVFRRDFVEAHPDTVESIVRVYSKQILGSRAKRQRENSDDLDASSEEREVLDMSFPVVDTPPLVKLDRLDGWQELLLRYKYLDRKLDVAPFVDNRFVEAAAKELASEN